MNDSSVLARFVKTRILKYYKVFWNNYLINIGSLCCWIISDICSFINICSILQFRDMEENDCKMCTEIFQLMFPQNYQFKIISDISIVISL